MATFLMGPNGKALSRSTAPSWGSLNSQQVTEGSCSSPSLGGGGASEGQLRVLVGSAHPLLSVYPTSDMYCVLSLRCSPASFLPGSCLQQSGLMCRAGVCGAGRCNSITEALFEGEPHSVDSQSMPLWLIHLNCYNVGEGRNVPCSLRGRQRGGWQSDIAS